MTKTNQTPSQSLKTRVKESGINLIVIAERSRIRYPRLRALINSDKTKLLYDEGLAIEEALQKSVTIVQRT